MHTYRVRPGYGSRKLLIEFGPDAGSQRFAADLKTVFLQNGVRVRSTGHYVLGVTVFFDSPAGRFQVNDDGYSIFVHADNNQPAIHFIDRALQKSGLFEKEEVDFSEYAQPPDRREPPPAV